MEREMDKFTKQENLQQAAATIIHNNTIYIGWNISSYNSNGHYIACNNTIYFSNRVDHNIF